MISFNSREDLSLLRQEVQDLQASLKVLTCNFNYNLLFITVYLTFSIFLYCRISLHNFLFVIVTGRTMVFRRTEKRTRQSARTTEASNFFKILIQ